MTHLLTVNRKTIVTACCLVLALSAGAVALNRKATNQRAQDAARNEALKQVNESPDQFLRVVGNDDCPLRIVEARVKEVPGQLFTQLTGKTTDLATISSVPETTLVNISGQTITGFILMIDDPQARKTRGLVKSEIAIRPGETYILKRELYVAPDKFVVVDATGRTQQKLVFPGLRSAHGWLEFASRSDLYVTIGRVNFETEGHWQIKQEGAGK